MRPNDSGWGCEGGAVRNYRAFPNNDEETLMTIRNRAPLFALAAIMGTALAMPAMAQDAKDQAAAAQASAQQAQSDAAQAQDAAADASASAAQASAAANGGGQTWASVDTDGDGAISKTEATANAGLAQVFDAADADKDGKLTQEEYRAFAAKQK